MGDTPYRYWVPCVSALVKGMAEEVRHSRLQLSYSHTPRPRPAGSKWLLRFRRRYHETGGIRERNIVGQRHKAMSVGTTKA